MKVTKHISTVFLTSAFASILLFALIFWLYSNSDSKTLALLKDALSTTSGFFGGITTLIAAYIASMLFNDWRHQHNASIKKALIEKTLDACDSYEATIHQSIEGIAKAKAGYVVEMKKQNNDRNYSDFDSILRDKHAAFIWGESVIKKHLICINNEKSFDIEIDLQQTIKNFRELKKPISKLFIEIINSDDLQRKIAGTDELNSLLAPYLVFINFDIYMKLSSHRFE